MNQQWRVGDIEVTCVVEAVFDVPPHVLVANFTADGITEHLDVLRPAYLTDDLLLRLAIQSFAIRAGDRRIIIDTCFGNDHDLPGIGVLHTEHLRSLADAGFDRLRVDTVVCTHLHLDHVGWNTMLVDGQWVPTFANAEYLFGATEHAHWSSQDQQYGCSDVSIEPIIAAGLHRFVENDHQIAPGIRLVPTPGHTPGHVSVHIESGGETALITGDVVHSPVQIFRHDWPSVPDWDPAMGKATREVLFAQLVGGDVLVLGTHFAEPTAGNIVRRDSGWGWQPRV